MSLNNESGKEVPSPEVEADLPPTPPPKEWKTAALPVIDKTATPAPGPPRLKKKVPWRGKNIMVLLPWDAERGMKGQAPLPLSQVEMTAMLKSWEELGYDTAGFNLGLEENLDEGSQGQSRSPWPLSEDVADERMQKKYRVSIPDRRGRLVYLLRGPSLLAPLASLH